MEYRKYLPFYQVYFGNVPGVGSAEAGSRNEEREPLLKEWHEQQEEEALMQFYYPGQLRELQGIIEEICEEEDYEGSRMYDEHPDAGMLRRLGVAAARRIREELPGLYEDADMEVSMLHGRPGLPPFPLPAERPRRRRPVQDLIDLLLYQEIRRRRWAHRQRQRR